MWCVNHLARLLPTLLVGACALFAQAGNPGSDSVPQPRQVTYCELSKNPAAYNHELVRLTAFVTRGFEDFHLGLTRPVPQRVSQSGLCTAAKPSRIRLIAVREKARKRGSAARVSDGGRCAGPIGR
jgi:hypothetical protein